MEQPTKENRKQQPVRLGGEAFSEVSFQLFFLLKYNIFLKLNFLMFLNYFNMLILKINFKK